MRQPASDGFVTTMPRNDILDAGADAGARAAVDFRKGTETYVTGRYFARSADTGRITHLTGFAGPPTP